MEISNETTTLVREGSLTELDFLACDIRDIINERQDAEEVISYLRDIGITVSEAFCRRKRPLPKSV